MNNRPKPINVPSVYGIPVGLLSRDEAEKARKLVQLQAQIRSKVESGILGNIYIPKAVDKPKPLILDEYGRTIDSTGKAIQLETVAPTLKANLRNRKKNETRTQERLSSAAEKTKMSSAGTAISSSLSSSVGIDSDSRYFDTRIEQKPAVRLKRQLVFNEPGKYVELAERQRKKIKLEKLQNEISQIAKKTGISSATKLALIAKAEPQTEGVPEVEWWDSVILTNNYETMGEDGRISIRESAITSLVEHPVQIRPLFETSRSAVLPVFLTKKERKKMRRQKRREARNEAQEKIRLGLEPAPEPKLRISNLMRVLSTEAVQDPTKIEALVREQMAQRQKTHEEANAARKLTKEQRREKKVRKLKEDTTSGVHVAVYRIRDLTIEMAAKKFKIETNAKQLFMTGCVALYPDCCVVVVEGGPKQQRKYKRLMLERIKWDEDDVRDPDGNLVPNSCVLVWQGMVTRRNFAEFKYKACESEKVARELFRKHRVEHYWDQAYSGAVLDHADD